MKNKEIKLRLKKTIEEAPTDLKSVVMTSEVSRMQEHDFITRQIETKKANRFLLRLSVAAASLAVLVIAVYFGYFIPFRAVDSIVYLDVNPSVAIRTNSREMVIDLDAINGDADSLVDGYDYRGKDLDTVAVELIAAFVEGGYVDELHNTILISVRNDDEARNVEQKERLYTAISDYLKYAEINPVIMVQSLEGDDHREDAEKIYHVSEGRLVFIERLIRGEDDLDITMLVGMSLEELRALAEDRNIDYNDFMDDDDSDDDDDAYDDDDDDKGTPITLDAAKAIALGQINGTIVDIDQDDDEYKFEITLEGTKYEIEIDTYTGEIVKFEMDDDDDDKDYTGTRITEEEARRIALSLANGNIVKMDQDDDNYKFEIYFDGKEYKIEINAYTGVVIKLEVDDDDDDEYSQGTRITEEEARRIALSLANGNIVKMDQGDEEYKYEIELEGKEYKIEIDAHTGEIIKFEMDEMDDDDDDSDDDSDDEDDVDDDSDDQD